MSILEIEKKTPLLYYIYIYIYISNTSFYFAMQVLHLTEHGFYDLHTGIYDWRVTVVRRLFIPFSYDLLVLMIKICDIKIKIVFIKT